MVFTRTEVDQMFFNLGDRDLEAIYSFPLPKQGSLSELSLWIDGREVVGEVLEEKEVDFRCQSYLYGYKGRNQ